MGRYYDMVKANYNKLRNEADAENAIIEMAVRFWFMDDDWEGNDKVWVYFRK